MENDALGNIKVRTKFRELYSLGLINLSRIFFKPGQFFHFGTIKEPVGKEMTEF